MQKITPDQLDELLGYVVAHNPDDVRQLLSDAGYKGLGPLKSNDLSKAWLKAIKDDAKFRAVTADYLTGMVMHESSSFVSNSKQTTFNIVDATGTTTTTEKPKSTLWSTLGSAANINTMLNTGLGVLSTSLQTKANRESEERALQAKALDLQIAQTNAAAAAASANAPKSKGMSTGTVIGIIAGLAGLGVLIYFLVKKKK